LHLWTKVPPDRRDVTDSPDNAELRLFFNWEHVTAVPVFRSLNRKNRRSVVSVESVNPSDPVEP